MPTSSTHITHPDLLGSEEKMLRDSAKDFARQVIAPKVAQMDTHAQLDEHILQELFEMGFMGIDVPSEYGGSGGNFMMSILTIEQISQVDPAVGVVVDVQNTLVNDVIRNYGTEDQKNYYLPQLCAHSLGAYALSEAQAGSDAFALSTTAKEFDDHFVLNGSKLWITNALEARLFIVFANAEPTEGYKGITAFIVERDNPGLSIGKKENKLGIRASSTCELHLDDCVIPKDALLGTIGQGYQIAINTLNVGRIGIGAQMVGLAQGAFDATLDYIEERKQFGRAISDFQAVRFELARMATEIETARLLVYAAATLKSHGKPFLKQAAMAKLHASEVAERISSKAIDLFGGNGYIKDYPVEKFFRDAKIGKIYEGTTNMQLSTIAKLLLR